MTDPSPWWDRDVHADRRPFLLARGRIQSALRDWFRRRGFLEVETPALQVSPGNEAHLHAFATELIDARRRAARRSTCTPRRSSPARSCWPPASRGSSAFAHVFRNRERGPLHHPEFTMLEWYRANEPYEALMAGLRRDPGRSGQGGRRPATAMEGPHRRSLCRAGAAHASPRHSTTFAGIDLLATLDGGEGDRDALAAAARAAGIQVADDDTWSDVFSRVLVERIEPRLGLGRPTLLDQYPLPEAALGAARPPTRASPSASSSTPAASSSPTASASSPTRPSSAAASRPRWRRRQRRYGERYPIDEDFLAALAAMPPASGIALGFDRLVMLATGATRIEQVLWAPVAGDDR